jgi:hypothetical protein
VSFAERDGAEERPEADVVLGLNDAGEGEGCADQVGLDEKAGDQRVDRADGVAGAVGAGGSGGSSG